MFDGRPGRKATVAFQMFSLASPARRTCLAGTVRPAQWHCRRRPGRVIACHAHSAWLTDSPQGKPRFRPEMRLSPCVQHCAPPSRQCRI